MGAAIGSETFISFLGTPIDTRRSNTASAWKTAGKSVALLALRPLSLSDGAEAAFKLSAQFATTDPLRHEASSVLCALRKQGLSIWMISGDNATTPRPWGINSASQLAISLPAFSPRRRLTRSAGYNLPPLNATARLGERSWRWSEMASTTLQPSLLQTQESLSAPAQMLLSQVPSSY